VVFKIFEISSLKQKSNFCKQSGELYEIRARKNKGRNNEREEGGSGQR